MNYCIGTLWYGGDQPLALLSCYGHPSCFDGWPLLGLVSHKILYENPLYQNIRIFLKIKKNGFITQKC